MRTFVRLGSIATEKSRSLTPLAKGASGFGMTGGERKRKTNTDSSATHVQFCFSFRVTPSTMHRCGASALLLERKTKRQKDGIMSLHNARFGRHAHSRQSQHRIIPALLCACLLVLAA